MPKGAMTTNLDKLVEDAARELFSDEILSAVEARKRLLMAENLELDADEGQLEAAQF